MIFKDDQCLVVTTRGPGRLHLLSYQSNGGLTNNVGSRPTTNSGVTRFMVSFSHTYERFAFIWDGDGEAVYGVGHGLKRLPVGKSWGQASAIEWGSSTVTTTDVSKLVGPLSGNTNITCFIIPDKI